MKIQQNMDVQNNLIQDLRGVISASKSHTNNTQSPYISFYQKETLMLQKPQQSEAGRTFTFAPEKDKSAKLLTKYANKVTEDNVPISQQMRQMIRDLKKEKYAAKTNRDKVNGFSELSGFPDAAEEEEIDTSDDYNYKTVASKIQRAKTSISAGQAVLAARREVLKIKRKISSGDGDPEELQFALTHAKRMEMVARKKKHHLELEEMVERTQSRDEKLDNQRDVGMQMQSTLAFAEEEKLSEKEDAIFDAREEMLDAALQHMQEEETSFSEEELKELNEMISEFGEEELKELEEAVELMETMEVVDPHMSKADLEELKRKHRASEDKAIMKANMEYFKDMIKHELVKHASIPGMRGGNGISSAATFSVSAPQIQSPTIDIQV